MSTTSMRHASRALTIAAVAALGLAACGSTADEPAAASSAGSAESITSSSASPTQSQAPSDATTATTGESDGGAGAAGGAEIEDRPFLALAKPEVPADEGSGDVWPADLVASTLGREITASDTPGAATCEEDLELAPGTSITCSAYPNTPDGEANTEHVPWTAYSVAVPDQGGPAATRAVLYVRGGGLDGEAKELVSEGYMLTGNRMGTGAISQDLSADEVAERTLHLLTAETSIIDARGVAEWQDVTCEDGLSAEGFEVASCTATTPDGGVALKVAPGNWVGYDKGLLVAIDQTDLH